MVKDLRLFFNGIRTSWKGMRLTFRHLRKSGHRTSNQNIQSDHYFDRRDGQSTVLYPYEEVPVPDHGRYKLHNEIEDCIVCDKCAKICPVDCIDIEPIKSAEEFGKTSDGTPRRIYAAKFDIDMAKCCYCGLCTTVCPTECLTMTPEYDFAVLDLEKLNFGFGNMTEEEAEIRRQEWELARQKKEEAKAQAAASPARPTESPAPGFRPRMRPAMPGAPKTEDSNSQSEKPGAKEPVDTGTQPLAQNPEPPQAYVPKARPRPILKKPEPPSTDSTTEGNG